MAFQTTATVDTDGDYCGQCRFLLRNGARNECVLFDDFLGRDSARHGSFTLRCADCKKSEKEASNVQQT